MEFHSDDQYNGYGAPNRPPLQPRDAMTSASIVLSAIAIATSCCIYASIVCGALSIILALLSRGEQKKLSPQGKLAITTSVVAIVLTAATTGYMLFTTIREYGSIENFMKAYSELFENMTGTPLFPEGGV